MDIVSVEWASAPDLLASAPLASNVPSMLKEKKKEKLAGNTGEMVLELIKCV